VALIASIFLDFSLPNAATWFYFSLLLVFALFCKWEWKLHLLNWDLFALFLMVPGLLALQEAHALKALVDTQDPNLDLERIAHRAARMLSVGYIWLISASGFWFLRCIADLAFDQRSPFHSNLNLQGLTCLAVAMFVALSIVAIRRLPDTPAQVGRGPVALSRVKEGAVSIASYQPAVADLSEADRVFWVERGVVIALHAAVVVGLFVVGVVQFRNPTAGAGVVCLYLLLPYTGYHVSQLHHVWPGLLMLWAVAAYRRPLISGAILGLASGTVFFPMLVFPLWFGFYRGRGTGRFTIAFFVTALITIGIVALILSSSGDLKKYVKIALSLSDWQAWKVPQTESIWRGAYWAYRMPVFVVYLAFVFLTVFWPSPRNLGHVIAQTTAVVIGVQFWYADQGGVYVLWYLPLLLLMVFRPTLTEARPPALNEEDWVRRAARRAGIRRGADPSAKSVA